MTQPATYPVGNEGTKRQIALSIGLVLLSCLCFTTGMTLAKTVSPSVSSTMILFFRCLFGFVLFLPAVFKQGAAHLRTRRPLLHLVRVFLSCGATFCTYAAYRKIPLATASSIGYTGPLFTTLMAAFLLKERISFKISEVPPPMGPKRLSRNKRASGYSSM